MVFLSFVYFETKIQFPYSQSQCQGHLCNKWKASHLFGRTNELIFKAFHFPVERLIAFCLFLIIIIIILIILPPSFVIPL